jgi:hypothetical protein
MQIGHPNSHNIELITLCPHIPWSGMQMEQKGTRCVLLLPHRRSWGSGRWMCTCTANSRHNPPTIQRYIPNNVQRKDSSSSEDGVMGGNLGWFLLSVYFELLLDVGNEHGEQFARGGWSSWENCSSWQIDRLARRRTRTVVPPSSDGNGAFVSAVPGKRFHFITAVGL